MGPQEYERNKKHANVITSYVKYACDKDGELIKKFIAENGLACLRSKQDALASFVVSYFRTEIGDIGEIYRCTN